MMAAQSGSIFLDTSAVIRYLLDEEGGSAVEREVEGAARVVASRLLQVEAQRALWQIVEDKPSAEAQLPQWERALEILWAKTDFIEMSREICASASRILPRSRLRSLDAIHLATYLHARRIEPQIEMLSFDRRLITAAQEARRVVQR
jgi:predicted nucleic acid-binding protein